MIRQNLLVFTILFGLVILVGGVSAENHAPVAVADSFHTHMNTALDIAAPGLLANDYDPDGDEITAVAVSEPAHGTLINAQTDGHFTYMPDPDYIGTDSFIYDITDGTLYSGYATVTITVGNTAPVAVDDSYIAQKNTQLDVSPPGPLANDWDPEGDAITVAAVGAPAHGTLINAQTDGHFTYMPDPDYIGTDSFIYDITDGTLYSGYATITITVKDNHAPVATDDGYVTRVNKPLTIAAPGILKNDVDPDGDPLKVKSVTAPSHGLLSFSADGWFTYTPSTGYSGLDHFTYRVTDGQLTSSMATVTLLVYANSPPVAVADSYTTARNTELTVAAPGILANDMDPDGDPITCFMTVPPIHGAMIIYPDGHFAYTPNTDYVGTDSFMYVAKDGEFDSAPAMVTITVNGGEGVSMSIAKSVDKTALPAGGGDVVYTYNVKNTGDAGVTSLTLTDDKLGVIAAIPSGDNNGNGILDAGETWTYTVPAHLTQTTTNTAAAMGMTPAGLPVTSTSNAITVSVEAIPTPEFPALFVPALYLLGFTGAVFLIRKGRD